VRKTYLYDLKQIGPLVIPPNADAPSLLLAFSLIDLSNDVRRFASFDPSEVRSDKGGSS
jgi:hypothetical protein